MIELREYLFGSADYDAAIRLRDSVLRAPLGLSFTPSELAQESADFHIGAFENGVLVGTLTLTPASSGLRMRQVAVESEKRGLGIGRALVEFSERFARERGATRIELHARLSVASFYTGLGYRIEGEEFEEVTIPHLAMSKSL